MERRGTPSRGQGRWKGGFLFAASPRLVHRRVRGCESPNRRSIGRADRQSDRKGPGGPCRSGRRRGGVRTRGRAARRPAATAAATTAVAVPIVAVTVAAGAATIEVATGAAGAGTIEVTTGVAEADGADTRQGEDSSSMTGRGGSGCFTGE